MERKKAKDKDIHMAFADLKKAYDSVPRSELWEAMHKLEIQNMGTTTKGLLQGCSTSPTLFKIYLESTLKTCFTETEGLNFDTVPATSRDSDLLLKTNTSADVTNIHHQTSPQEEASEDLHQIISQKIQRRPRTSSSSSDSSLEEITEISGDDATDDENKSVELKHTSFEELRPLPAPRIQRVCKKETNVCNTYFFSTENGIRGKGSEEKEEESFAGYKKCNSRRLSRKLMIRSRVNSILLQRANKRANCIQPVKNLEKMKSGGDVDVAERDCMLYVRNCLAHKILHLA
ncbi:hypothetical protein ILUMI_10997 [Ignelater luminosus]|uniref:Reverse transcriptase domain-containing protein n=1 Tax=Ignelater luminosus TaxID=2038154 RepID=A0A8K0GD37_IGNLU|nr:hypothetical protein ILUMI_10997 [Ignelater luminosus]